MRELELGGEDSSRVGKFDDLIVFGIYSESSFLCIIIKR